MDETQHQYKPGDDAGLSLWQFMQEAMPGDFDNSDDSVKNLAKDLIEAGYATKHIRPNPPIDIDAVVAELEQWADRADKAYEQEAQSYYCGYADACRTAITDLLRPKPKTAEEIVDGCTCGCIGGKNIIEALQDEGYKIVREDA